MTLPLLSALLLALPSAPQAAPEAAGPPVLELDGEPIPRDEFGDWLVQHRGPLMAEVFARTRLIERAATAKGVTATEEEVDGRVTALTEERVRSAFAGSRERWLDEVVRLGRSERGLAAERAIQQRSSLLLERLMAGEREIPDEVLRKAWEKEYGFEGKKPRLRLIHTAMRGVSSRRQVPPEEQERAEADARARADAAYSRLVAGADFARVAREASEDDRSRLADGLAPEEFTLGAWPPESVEAVTALAPGKYTTPVRGPGGFWIVQLVEIVETPFDEVREALEADLLTRAPGTDEERLFLEELVGSSAHTVLPAMNRGPEIARGRLPQDEPVLRIGDEEVTRGQYATWLRHYRGEDMAERFALWWKLERLAEESEIDLAPEVVEARALADRDLLVEVNFDGDLEAWKADLALTGRTEEAYTIESFLRTRSTMIAETLLIREREIADDAVRYEWRERYGPEGVGLWVRMLVLRPAPPTIEPGTTREELDRVIEEAFAATGQRARELVERVLDGEDFGTLARQFSDDERTREQGGRVDERFRPEQWAGPVADAVTALQPGGVTEPVRLSDAFLIFELLERREVAFEDVRDELREELRTERPKEPELAAFRNITQQSVPSTLLPAMYE